MALRTRQRLLPRRHPTSSPSGSCPPAGWWPTSPASRCSATRPSSARTPSPTRPASTRTACSRNAPPTRSCGPRTSASPRPTWCWASTAAAPPWPIAPRRWATRSSAEQLDTVFEQFKVLADKKKDIYDGDIAVARSSSRSTPSPSSGRSSPTGWPPARGRTPEVELRPRRGGEKFTAEDGRRRRPDRRHLPGHRADHRHRRSCCKDFQRPQRHRRQGRPGRGAWCEVEHDGRTYRGRGVSTDSVEASAKAFLNADQPHRGGHQRTQAARRAHRSSRRRLAMCDRCSDCQRANTVLPAGHLVPPDRGRVAEWQTLGI